MDTFNGKNIIDIYNELAELEAQNYAPDKINEILRLKYGKDIDAEAIKEMKEREEMVNKIGNDFFDLKQQGYTIEKINEILTIKYDIKETEIETIVLEKKTIDEKEKKEKQKQERTEKANEAKEELKNDFNGCIGWVIAIIIAFFLIPGPGNCFYGG